MRLHSAHRQTRNTAWDRLRLYLMMILMDTNKSKIQIFRKFKYSQASASISYGINGMISYTSDDIKKLVSIPVLIFS